MVELMNPMLRNYVLYSLNKIENFVEEYELMAIKSIELNSRDIVDNLNPVFFEELRYFPNLESIWLSNLNISREDFKYLLNCKKLKEIYCFNCNIESIEGLEALTKLETVELTRTYILNIDLLKNIKSLKELGLINIVVKDLNFLAGLSNLSTLGLSYAKLKKLDSLDDIKYIRKLSVDNTNVNDFNFLNNYKQLSELEISLDQIKDNKRILLELLKNNVKIYEKDGILSKPFESGV